jgi:hypothetical protein
MQHFVSCHLAVPNHMSKTWLMRSKDKFIYFINFSDAKSYTKSSNVVEFSNKHFRSAGNIRVFGRGKQGQLTKLKHKAIKAEEA